jgi:16S rRNA processing protein RimM
MLVAGVVGRPHGLDGSFYVARPQSHLLELGAVLSVGGDTTTIVRRAGTDKRPILRVASCSDRSAAERMRGVELVVSDVDAPPLGPDEYLAEELEGSRVLDGEVELGVVRRMMVLPSCECLVVTRSGGGPDLLVPMVHDAIRSVDVARRVIEVDRRFLGEAAEG